MRGDRVRTPQGQQARRAEQVQQIPQVQQVDQSHRMRQSRLWQQPEHMHRPQESHEPQRPWQWPAPVPLPGAAYPDWEAIYTDNVGRIYRLMFSKVGNRPDAEDLTSQVFLTANGPLRTTAGVAQVRAYLTATARTVLAEHWRRTLGHQVTEIDLETTDLANYTGIGAGSAGGLGTGASSSTGIDTGADFGAGYGADGGAGTGVSAGVGAGAGGFGAEGYSAADARAARILEALPQRQRQILVLRFLRGYTIRQAAAELGVTVANAKVLQHRALKAAARMEDSHVEGGERYEHGERGAGRGKEREAEQGAQRGAGRGAERTERGAGQEAERGAGLEPRRGTNRELKQAKDEEEEAR